MVVMAEYSKLSRCEVTPLPATSSVIPSIEAKNIVVMNDAVSGHKGN